MDIDFSLILTLAMLACGFLWLIDVVFFKPRRQRNLERAKKEAENANSMLTLETEQEILREPWLFETAHSFFPVLAVVWFLRSFIAEPFTIPSGSMLPSLEVGDYVLVNKFTYGIKLPVLNLELIPMGLPKRGDIMVFRFPEQPSINYIKRVIGLPGDEIESRDEHLFINGVEVTRELIAETSFESRYVETMNGRKYAVQEQTGIYAAGMSWKYTVPEGHYFVMGDNRDNSNDSRFWGPVAQELIVGKAFYIWMHKQPGLHWPSFHRNGVTK
jgi:signal peptidase I